MCDDVGEALLPNIVVKTGLFPSEQFRVVTPLNCLEMRIVAYPVVHRGLKMLVVAYKQGIDAYSYFLWYSI